MSKINAIQQAILQLDGGKYQKLMDAYLYKKFKYTNIEPLGSHTGTDKVTKGIPDSYVKLDNGRYILIMYGAVESTSYEKIEKDIKSCLDKKKLDIDIKEIEEIICCYTSTNIHIEQKKKLENIFEGVKITLVGIGTVSHDLLIKYPTIASDLLDISIDTEQIFDIGEFISRYDKTKVNAPIKMDLLHRESELENLSNKLENNKVLLIFGKSGIGKTRLALELARLYEKKYNATALCIKNNGQMLYNDLKYYLSDSGEYLLFVDDANQITQLEHILNYAIIPPEGINVKIIMTVRDYARDRVKSIIYNKLTPEEIEIDVLKDEAIRDILIKNLHIRNDKYLDRIGDISKGNARIAVLAGKISKKNGLASINNSVDIFKYYYGEIIEKQFHDKNKIIVAFIITLLGPFEYEKNILVIEILKDIGIYEEEFYKICYELNENEIVDLYMNKAVKISDQSMGDYLLYYVLIEKKFINLDYLIKKLFRAYKRKLIYVLNTIMNLFYSEDNFKYIKEQVNSAWNTIEGNKEKLEYLKAFYQFNEEKSLAYIKKKIDLMDEEDILLDYSKLKERENNKSISSETLEILGNFKYSNNYELALELILYYFKKRPYKARNFYIVLSDRLGYDKHSYGWQYEKEILNIEFLWGKSNDGLDKNITLLLLSVIDKYLELEFNCIEMSTNNSGNILTFNLCKCEGLEKLRKTMWFILGRLYNQEIYRGVINEILVNYDTYCKNDNQVKLIYEIDIKYIIKYIFREITEPEIIQCKILKKFKNINIRLGVEVDEVLNRYKNNKEFLIYNTIVDNDNFNIDWENKEQRKKENIYNMVKFYTEDDFIKLFNLCNKVLNEMGTREYWEFNESIRFIFDGIRENKQQYISAVKAYLKCNTPFNSAYVNQVHNLIKIVGFEEAEQIIFNYDYKLKNIWIYEYLSSIPKERISIKYVNLLRNVFEDGIKEEYPQVPDIQSIQLYKNVDENIIYDLSLKLLTSNIQHKSHAIKYFLGNIFEDENVNIILSLFSNDIGVLENLYIDAIEEHIDYDGKLFISLVKNNINFLDRFIRKLIDVDDVNDMYYHKRKFELLWEEENYDELIQISLDTIFSIELYPWEHKSHVKKIFSNDANTSNAIKGRKIEWIKNYIRQFSSNEEKLNLIFDVVSSTFKQSRIELIAYFLNINKDVEMFKKLLLFPVEKSWSGSEVPLIEDEITFLELLMKSINSIDYIEHKAYLKDYIAHKERYKQDVLVREYLEDQDLS